MAEFAFININNIYNHKFIVDDDFDENDYEGMNKGMDGRYFKGSLLPDSLEKVIIEGVPFIFPDKSNHKYDNFICEEQCIKVDKGSYKKIHFLGCSEFDNLKDEIVLLSEGCITKHEKIAFNHCFFGYFTENKNWEYDIVQNCSNAFKSEDTQRKWPMYIYLYSIDLIDVDIAIESICFPYNPLIHIFAITLES